STFRPASKWPPPMKEPSLPEVYPPRYFPGWCILEKSDGARVQVLLAPAVLLPLSERRAVIYPSNPGSPYVSARHTPPLAGQLREIQYAISVFDAKAGAHFIEKFNHVFSCAVHLTQRFGRLEIEPVSSTRALFGAYRLDTIVTGPSANPLPCVQFIA
ncbi:MAG: hypothetical protein ACRD2F_03595, partial [Terriglobales bacterium]